MSVSVCLNGRPLQSVEITVEQGTNVVATASTGAFGRYILHMIPTAGYVLAAMHR